MKKSRTVWLGAALLGMGGLLLGVALLTIVPAQVAEEGDTVRLNYTLKLEDGLVYDSSDGREPLEFTLGKGMVIPGLEEAVNGMRIRETRTVRIPPEKAYGPYRPELVSEVNRSELPEGMEPVVGQLLGSHAADGVLMVVVIRGMSETTVTLDSNPILAGQTLIFDIELVGMGPSKTPSGGSHRRLHPQELVRPTTRVN